MTVNMQKVVSASSFSGLGNNQSKSFSVDIASQSLATNAAIVKVAQTAIVNSSSISEVQIRYTGLDTKWYLLDGSRIYSAVSGDFTITTRRYIQDGVLNISNFILEIPGVGITLPSFSIDCRAYLYDAPFS